MTKRLMADKVSPTLIPNQVLQLYNNNPREKLIPVKPAQIKKNYFGVCSLMPRSPAFVEHPFSSDNLIDGNHSTSWSDRGHRLEDHGTGWICIELAKPQSIDKVILVPRLNGSGFPRSFQIQGSMDNKHWSVLHEAAEQRQPVAGKSVEFTFQSRRVRFVRLFAVKFHKIETPVISMPNCFGFELAEMEIYGKDKTNLALKTNGARVSVSSTNYYWWTDPDEIDATWHLIKDLGVKHVRIGQWGDSTDWTAVERQKGKYSIDPALDRAVTDAARHGVNCTITLCYGNSLYQKWEEPVPLERTKWTRCNPAFQPPPTTDEAVEGFCRYAEFMVRHFKNRVHCWEIWNEADLWIFWPPKGNPEAYVRLVKESSARIKRIDPKAKIMFGVSALAFDFAPKCLKLGVEKHIDAFAFHPYRHDRIPEEPCRVSTWGKTYAALFNSYEEEVGALRALFNKKNPPVEMWANEISWFAGVPSRSHIEAWGPDVSELTQAKYLLRFYVVSAFLRVYSCWWSLYVGSPFQEWALLRSGLAGVRPSYYALRNLCTVLSDTEPVAVKDRITVVPERVNSARELKVFGFKKPGKTYIGLWVAMKGRDDCEGIRTEMKLNMSGMKEIYVNDLMNATRQKIEFRRPKKDMIEIRNLALYDYPLVLEISPVTSPAT